MFDAQKVNSQFNLNNLPNVSSPTEQLDFTSIHVFILYFTAKCCDLGICSHILLKTSFNLPSFLSFFLIKIVLLNHLTNYPLRQDIQVYNNQKNTYEHI